MSQQAISFSRLRDDFGEFSNFAAFPFVLDGKTWPTSEHYFQAQKFAGTEYEEAIRQAPSPREAARMGRDRTKPLREDWESVKESIMLDALRAKFSQHDALTEQLLSTGNAHLVEYSQRDRYWGNGGDGTGQNRLGELLKQIRTELRLNQLATESQSPATQSQPQPRQEILRMAPTSDAPPANSLTYAHFDVSTGEWLRAPDSDITQRIVEQLVNSEGQTSKENLQAVAASLEQQSQRETSRANAQAEVLTNTLLAAFCPEAKDGDLSFGHADGKYVTAEQLRHAHPEGHRLLLASGSRLVYAADWIVDRIEQILPDMKDRAAYASLFLGECPSTLNQKMKILVVDDETGKNGDVLPNDVAQWLVADCFGQINADLAPQLADPNRLIQYRMGIVAAANPQSGDFETSYRLAKGTLTPRDLSRFLPPAAADIQLIVPVSSFKGGADKPSPGVHTVAAWLSKKAESEPGRMSFSQGIPMFPEAKQDFLNKTVQAGLKLAAAQADPRKRAQLYCEDHEERQALRQQRLQTQAAAGESAETTLMLEDLAEGADTDAETRTDPAMYTLLKAVVDNPDNYELSLLLEHQKVVDTLNRYLQKRWTELANGKHYKFPHRSTVIAAQGELREGEIGCPEYPEGKEILFFRAPLLSSNGIRVAKNRYTDIVLDPKGNPFSGVIAVGSESISQLRERITALAQRGLARQRSLDDDTPLPEDLTAEVQALLDQVVGKGREIPNNPTLQVARQQLEQLIYAGSDPNEDSTLIGLWVDAHIRGETTVEAMGMDFDGDTAGFVDADAPGFQQLAEAVKVRNRPENCYAPTKKEKKQPFEPGTTLEDIALIMLGAQGVVGQINNQLTTIHALESEMVLLQEEGTLEDKRQYVKTVGNYYNELLSDLKISAFYRKNMVAIADLAASADTLTEAQTRTAMAHNQAIYSRMVEETCYENQVAVDMFKSSLEANLPYVKWLEKLLHREVAYIRGKKDRDNFKNKDRTVPVNGASMGEAVVRTTNRIFERAKSEEQVRHTQEFSVLFPPCDDPDKIALARAYQTKINGFWRGAQALDQKQRTEKGPAFKVTAASGKTFEITNLDAKWVKAGLPDALNIRLVENRDHNYPDHQLLAQAQPLPTPEQPEPSYRELGTVCEIARQQLNLQAGDEYTNLTGKLAQPQTERQRELLMEAANQERERFRQSIPRADWSAMHAALWHLSAPRTQYTQTTPNGQRRYPTATAALTTFPEVITEYLTQQPPINVLLQGLAQPTNQLPREVWAADPSQTVNIKVRAEEDGKHWIDVENPAQAGDFIPFSYIHDKSLQLQPGTTAAATIQPLSSTAEIVLADDGYAFKVGVMEQHDLSGQLLNGDYDLAIATRPIRETYLEIVDPQTGTSKRLGKLSDAAKGAIAAAFPNWDATSGEPPTFNAVLNTSGEEASTHINVTFNTPKGDRSFSVNPSSVKENAQDHRYNNQPATLKIVSKQVDRHFVTTEIEGKTLTLGCLNKNYAKKWLTQLQARGIKPDATDASGQLQTFPAKVKSHVTTAQLQLDARSIVWPQPEVTLESADVQPGNPDEKRLDRLINQVLQQRPTLLGRTPPSPTWLEQQTASGTSLEIHQPTLRLAVSAQAADAMANQLQSSAVPFRQIPVSDCSIQREVARDYVVFEMPEREVPETLLTHLELEHNSPLRSQKDYDQTLRTIPQQTLRDFEATPSSILQLDATSASAPTAETSGLSAIVAAPDRIRRLQPDQVFVFGSNDLGIHGAGAAQDAFGITYHQAHKENPNLKTGRWAQWGVGRGYQEGDEGASYAIATKPSPYAGPQSMSLDAIAPQVHGLIAFAQEHPDQVFLCSRFGTGFSGFTDPQMASLWEGKAIPPNIHLPQPWIDHLQTPPETKLTETLNMSASSTQAETATQATSQASQLAAYVDGSCLNNPGPGGWGVRVESEGGAFVHEFGGSQDATTNNRMELQAAIAALQWVKENAPAGSSVELYSDSEYFINVATKWLANWKDKGWIKSDGKPIENPNLIKDLDTVMNQLGNIQLNYQHVKGHAGIPGNERVDAIARSFANGKPVELETTQPLTAQQTTLTEQTNNMSTETTTAPPSSTSSSEKQPWIVSELQEVRDAFKSRVENNTPAGVYVLKTKGDKPYVSDTLYYGNADTCKENNWVTKAGTPHVYREEWQDILEWRDKAAAEGIYLNYKGKILDKENKDITTTANDTREIRTAIKTLKKLLDLDPRPKNFTYQSDSEFLINAAKFNLDKWEASKWTRKDGTSLSDPKSFGEKKVASLRELHALKKQVEAKGMSITWEATPELQQQIDASKQENVAATSPSTPSDVSVTEEITKINQRLDGIESKVKEVSDLQKTVGDLQKLVKQFETGANAVVPSKFAQTKTPTQEPKPQKEQLTMG